MSLIDEIGVVPTTAGGALLLVCVLIITGAIPSVGEMRRTRADLQTARETVKELTSAALTQGNTLGKILASVQTTEHALTAISSGVVQRREGQ